MKTKSIIFAVYFLCAAMALPITAHAAIPHLVNFQGKATDKAGVPLSGTYNLTFRIYNSESGGSQKWSETQSAIPISNGIFQVQLGSVTPLNLTFDEPYWVSIEINTDGEMSPRTKLASVPYAYKAESLSKDPVIPFYKKGFDIEYVDFNSVKITPGVMDLAGKMFTATAYSNTLQLSYPDNPVSRDWAHGLKTNNSAVYIYAYDNNGQISFKFSDERPNLSDQYGNTAKKPCIYRRYPDTAQGVYYRYVGRGIVNSIGNLRDVRQVSDERPSIFDQFGGDGSQGNVTISSDTNFSMIDDPDRPGMLQATALSIDAGKTLTVDTGFAYIGVSGTCTINGTISADGQGEEGGDIITLAESTAATAGKIGASSNYDFTTSSVRGAVMTSVGTPPAVVAGIPQCEISNSLGGAGGGGGGTDEWYYNCKEGGAGGGAGNSGGQGGEAITNNHVATVSHAGATGNATTTAKKVILSLGVGDNTTSMKGFNQSILRFSRGAGGGSGGIANYAEGTPGNGSCGAGGAGGGVIYIECGTLVCGANGTITADGAVGVIAVNTGNTIGAGGGGGGGGTIIIRAKVITTTPVAANVTVTGGTGGTGNGGAGAGGNGADGFKDIVEVT